MPPRGIVAIVKSMVMPADNDLQSGRTIAVVIAAVEQLAVRFAIV